MVFVSRTSKVGWTTACVSQAIKDHAANGVRTKTLSPSVVLSTHSFLNFSMLLSFAALKCNDTLCSGQGECVEDLLLEEGVSCNCYTGWIGDTCLISNSSNI